MDENAAFLRELSDLSPIGVTVWSLEDPNDDDSLTFVFANAVAAKHTKTDVTDAKGRRMSELFPATTPARRKLYADVVRTRVPLETTLESAVSGSKDIFAVRCYPLREKWLAIWMENLTMRNRLDEAERISLDAVIEHLPSMVFVKEAKELRFTRINRAGEKLLGIGRESMLGKNDYDFFPKEQADFFTAKDRAALASTEAIDIPEEPIQTPAGERWLHTKKIPLRDAEGKPQYLLGISIDITATRQAQQALREAKDATEMANRELEAFSYSVAHDLRAPLRAIDGFAAMLAEESGSVLDARARDHIARMRKASTNMGRLIDDLLALARITRTTLTRTDVDLTELAHATVAAHLAGRNAEVVIASGLHAFADRGLMRILLDNLIGNAVKFSSKTPQPRIEIGSEGGAFFVKDNGAGFDEAYAGKLFAPFERLHSGHDFPGSGIGLAIVERIVHRHRGTVQAAGQVGKGATFRFTLGPV